MKFTFIKKTCKDPDLLKIKTTEQDDSKLRRIYYKNKYSKYRENTGKLYLVIPLHLIATIYKPFL